VGTAERQSSPVGTGAVAVWVQMMAAPDKGVKVTSNSVSEKSVTSLSS